MEGVEQSGESQLRDVAVQMIQAMKETPAEVAGKWAGIIAVLCANQGTAAILSTTTG